MQLQIDKQPILGALDDLDFTTDNPVEINASILYRRLDSHTLRNDGSQTAPPTAHHCCLRPRSAMPTPAS